MPSASPGFHLHNKLTLRFIPTIMVAHNTMKAKLFYAHETTKLENHSKNRAFSASCDPALHDLRDRDDAALADWLYLLHAVIQPFCRRRGARAANSPRQSASAQALEVCRHGVHHADLSRVSAGACADHTGRDRCRLRAGSLRKPLHAPHHARAHGGGLSAARHGLPLAKAAGLALGAAALRVAAVHSAAGEAGRPLGALLLKAAKAIHRED